jgi:cytochrome oxidase Cu insertion factor (SCO1/SenC/PrrC family)
MRSNSSGRQRFFTAMTWLVLTAIATAGQAQQRGQSDRISGVPEIGQPLPEVTVYLPDGTPFSTRELKGSYTVLVFGCLT